MKSFMRGLIPVTASRTQAGLVGKMMKIGAYSVRIESLLGEGGFAQIYKARDSVSNAAYALKHMRLMGEGEALADCHAEIDTLQQLRGLPHILNLKAVVMTGPKGAEQEAYLLLDLCQENLVEFCMRRASPLPNSEVAQIFLAACKALSALHLQQPTMAHRDLKAENLLLASTGEWVLCDFGSVTTTFRQYESSNDILMGEDVMRRYTTPAYRAPEMWDLYSREKIDIKADIRALGCLLYYLLFSKLAFNPDAKLQILNGEFTVAGNRPPALVALLRELLVVAPARRPDITHVLEKAEKLAAVFKPESSRPPSRKQSFSGSEAAAGQPQRPAAAQPAPGASHGHFTPSPSPAAPAWQAEWPEPEPAGPTPPEPAADPPQAQLISIADDAPPPPAAPARPPASHATPSFPHTSSPEPRPGHTTPPRGQDDGVLSVQRQLAEANSKLASLTATCRSQQQQISQLQAENAALRKSAQSSPAPSKGGWVASFGSQQAPAAQEATPGPAGSRDSPQAPSTASSQQGSPGRPGLSVRSRPGGGAATSPPSRHHSSTGEQQQFDPFGIAGSPTGENGTTATAAGAEPAADPFFQQEDGGQIGAGHFDAFGDHSAGKLPSYPEDGEDEDASTPLAAVTPTKGVKSKLRLKGFHRRTSSEPTPIESWQRHVQQFPS